MSSFLSDEEKNDIDSVMGILHETFAKTIYAHAYGEILSVSYDPNYSSTYGNTAPVKSGNITVAPQRTEFSGRLLFNNKMNLRLMDLGDESALKISTEDGDVRLKVDSVGKAIVDKAKKIEIYGELYEKSTSARPHGVFAHNFFTYTLRKLN